ncbi:uncharacterized protein OCT59_028526 [Rhizophagus irregularis]|uniref:uncharacterized protein n=1 Tax=Rhizophagus irregularis TaxID=588596 RepID=UPI0019FAC1FC|nr:hypothetical protein OCT59_028526 [Rhizophagus irregularis]GET50964.1 hypothetical protein RIR_jg27777.t1 [Rhizophagus irregularis DAOM 181602=DAOM 197198]
MTCMLSLLYTALAGSDNLNDGFPTSSKVYSIKYHSLASVTLSTTSPSSISSALRLRPVNDDSICTDPWVNLFIKSSLLNSTKPNILPVDRHSIAQSRFPYPLRPSISFSGMILKSSS